MTFFKFICYKHITRRGWLIWI